MLRPRLRIPGIGRIAGGLISTPAPLSVPFAQQSLQAAAAVAQQSRSKHSVPQLDSSIIKEGIDGFMSAGTVDLAWTQYQTHLLEKLDQKTAETDFYNKDLKAIVLETAREPQHAAIFNYASMAHNNEFFFNRLTNKTVEMPEKLKYYLEQSFGSIETLRREMVFTADAMFGPGFVWLVKVQHPSMEDSFKVLTTYLAGTPYSGAHWRRQSIDVNTDIGGSSQQGIEAGRNYMNSSALGQSRKNPKQNGGVRIAPGGIDVHPVLCLNTWEHAWLGDYGFGLGGVNGKLEYAETWWYRIDWEKVEAAANLKQRKSMEGGGMAPRLSVGRY